MPAPPLRLGRALAAALLAASCSAEPGPPPPAPVVALAPPRAALSAALAPDPRTRVSLDEEKPDQQEALRFFLTHHAEPGGTLEPVSKPPRVAAIALENSARGNVDGMRPDADVEGATIPEGKRASRPVTMAPGECATFVAQGGLGVIDVDLFLTVGHGDAMRVLDQGGGAGPVAVIGGAGRCFKNPEKGPLSAELHAVARRGGGLVLVRGFRR